MPIKFKPYFTISSSIAHNLMRIEAINQFSTEEPSDHSQLLRSLDARQRKALSLFRKSDTVTSKEVGLLFGFQPRTSSQLCKRWVENGFLEIVDSSKKGRKYKLSERYALLV